MVSCGDEALQLHCHVYLAAAYIIALGFAHQHLLEDFENSTASLVGSRLLVQEKAVLCEGVIVGRHETEVTREVFTGLIEASLLLRPACLAEQIARVTTQLVAVEQVRGGGEKNGCP